MATIQVKRGAAAGLPTLASGEPGWTTDTHELYVGTGSGNTLIGPSSALADGDKGDVTVSSSGAVWTIDNNAVTFGKMQAVGANVLLGNDASGTAVEEISCTAAGRAILDDADAAAQRVTLGLEIGVNVQAYDADLAAIAALGDPGADRLLFWDDSAGSVAWLEAGTGLSISGTRITATGGSTAITTITADTTLDATHSTVLVNNSASLVVTLPAVSGTAGRIYKIKKISNNTHQVTIDTPGGELLDGAAAASLYALYDAIEVQSDGSNWYIVADTRREARPGTVATYAGSTLPDGWLSCDGSAVSRTTYARLFDAIGTTWGAGDGSTTFNLPDLRGRTAIGVGTGSGLTARSLAGSGGAETHVLSTGEIPSHTHADGLPAGSSGGRIGYRLATDADNDGTQVSAGTGGGGAHANMQPWRAVHFIIKT